ncbi:MAG: hypothetical protein AAF566_04695 [Pseudomonadota bacterium]
MEFTEAVAKKLGFYVYRLIDPRNGETFYVGKGKGNRVFRHLVDALVVEDFDETQDGVTEKTSRIREILSTKLNVLSVLHRHGMDEKTAYEVEAALIDATPGLSNEIRGHGSDRGPASPSEIEFRYGLPLLPETNDPIVLININRLEDNSSVEAIYNQVRFSWRVADERVRKAEYVIAVVRGVSVGIFSDVNWMPATDPVFESFSPVPNSTRWGFIGKTAPEDVWQAFVGDRGKRLPDHLRHVQNPIRYWNIS